MDSTMVHVCLQTETAPSSGTEHVIGDRWVCRCGDNFVYREGFNRSGHETVDWWPAPAIPQPRNARRRGLLFGPRKG